MPAPKSKDGLLRRDDGTAQAARFYYGDGEEAPPDRMKIDPEAHATWIEEDGTIGIRRGTSVSVGASRAYTDKYDTIDWGN